jgi:2-keto-4-pentenoate hydratase/2-oxohepta-3-ene-1,7-dioic acid hydratase in catechol pathway
LADFSDEEKRKLMRLVTYSVFGEEKLGVHTESGVVDLKFGYERYLGSDAKSIFSDMRSLLSAGAPGLKLANEVVHVVLEREKQQNHLSLDSCIMRDGSFKLLPPVTRPDKILCPAVNYLEHGKEDNVTPPPEPYFFGKFVNSLTGHDGAVIIPSVSKKPDYEVELAAVIGKRGKRIAQNRAYEHIAGYTILNDISLRDLQGWPRANPTYGPHWLMGKAADTSCPMGPWIVTREELPNPYPLRIKLSVNGAVRQDSDTSHQIFKLPDLVSYVSQIMTLEPGDVVSTGTPAGVGRTSGVFLKDGDRIDAEIEKIGILRSFVRYESSK